MPTNIPQEIKDEIIEYLHDNENALKACSLASRTFLPSSQKHLFASILLLPPENRKGPTAAQFKELLKCSPHLGHYVRYLEIFDYDTNFLVLEKTRKDWLSKDTTLKFCLPLLMHLRGLLITYRRGIGNVQTNDVRYKLMVENGLLGVIQEVLRLPSLMLLDVEGLPVSFIQHCGPNIKQLALSGIRLVELSLPRPAEVDKPKVGLESLSFVAYSFGHIQKTIEESFNLASLKKLSASVRNIGEHQQVWNVITECLGTLEEFVLVAYSNVEDAISKDPIEWDKLSALKSLDIRLLSEYYLGDHIHSASFSWLVDSLAKMKSCSRLEKILIHIDYTLSELDSELDTDDLALWQNLIGLLHETDRFPCLRKVVLRISDPGQSYSEGDVADIISLVEGLIKDVKDPSPDFKVSPARAREEHPGFSPDPAWTKTKYWDLIRT